MGKIKRGKGTKLMAIADASGLRFALHTASASPHQATRVGATVDATFTCGLPHRPVGDRACDIDSLDAILAADNIGLIAPHRHNRRSITQDGHALR